ncbi:MAG: cyclic-di-AMP receptor [Oscillospiraceae bacterium]|nr:cyclic-di-AMP receptor [Oscillospiraceae bacterium]
MKLIFAIINNDDSHSVSNALTQSGFQATKLASTGGFLMSGNTTFLLCADDSRVNDIIEIIRGNSKKRKQFVPNAASFSSSGDSDGGGSGYSSFPVEVSVGGATIFVTNIERFEKV